MNSQKKPRIKLSENVLSKRDSLKNLSSIELSGKYIKLLPLDIQRDSEQLFMISNGSAIKRPNKSIEEYDSNELIWKYTRQRPFTNINDFTTYLHESINTENAKIFCIFDPIYNYQIGVAGLRTNLPEHLKTDIGFVWISPIAQGTQAATELCFLLLNHLFELGYRRIQWNIFLENIRSYKLAMKIGFSFEFLQKKYSICKERGMNATWLRILDCEWPEIKKRLEERLYSSNE